VLSASSWLAIVRVLVARAIFFIQGCLLVVGHHRSFLMPLRVPFCGYWWWSLEWLGLFIIMIFWCNDFFIVAASKDECQAKADAVLKLFSSIGIPLAEDKLEGPDQVLILILRSMWLGYLSISVERWWKQWELGRMRKSARNVSCYLWYCYSFEQRGDGECLIFRVIEVQRVDGNYSGIVFLVSNISITVKYLSGYCIADLLSRLQVDQFKLRSLSHQVEIMIPLSAIIRLLPKHHWDTYQQH